ncbi:mechanosensitive ion channel family protein [Sphingomonas sp. SORGH_AS_0879]|uniref:mechanosensitive ion channel family protein n=1 Tax=Sphingomonas sp. SORGH_AS_0879 TaxID=3041790 RepID=UPI0027879419|nr:mechanosensitive ion channel domain-containing protein [Sphingomonas sp. SORGH_AS_0879]MDQ1229397.1 small-conductance mechanosensitive channel [Sphingomonas sp. SORGH_AS_0879]
MTLFEWLQASGIELPTRAEAIEAGVAAALTLAMLAGGVVAGRKVGPHVAALIQRFAIAHGEAIQARICAITRHVAAAFLLMTLGAIWPWGSLAGVPIGLALGASVARAGFQLLRGLNLPRWLAWVFAIVCFVALFSREIGGLEPVTRLAEQIGFTVGSRRFSVMLLVTMLVTIVAILAVTRAVTRITEQWIGHARGLDPTQKLLAQKLASIGIVVIAFFFATDLLEIDLTSLALFSGGFGLAIGFGLQKTIGNLIAGIILLMDRSIKPGDVIALQNEIGWVNKIGVRAVSIITRDGKEHLIPNENLMTQEVENWSYSDRNVRVRIPVSIAYDSDLKLAQELMLRAAHESPRVLKSPKPSVWLMGFGDHALQHEILAWISDPESGVGNVRSDVLNRLWFLFKEHGVGLPYPQRDIHIRSLPMGERHENLGS